MKILTEDEARLLGWINADEYLPDNSREVLVAIRSSADILQGYYRGSEWYGSMIVRISMMENCNCDPRLNETVEYWHELPLHPKL